MAQLTSGTAVEQLMWTPDGRRVTYSTAEGVYSIPADGTGKSELLFSGAGYGPLSWTPDGKNLLGSTDGTIGEPWIWTAPSAGGDGKPRPFFSEPSLRHTVPQVSPDGRWLAYDARDAVQPQGVQVYVRPFFAPGGGIPVSINGGIIPKWSRDGRELFFTALGGDLMAAPIQASRVLAAGKPRRLFYLATSLFDVAPDGRFLVARSTPQDHLQVVVNWFDDLRQKAPSRR
jgi:Tol biopolymer transport system component